MSARCSTHCSAVPVSTACPMAGPVEKITVLLCLIALRRRSAIPGSSSSRYTRPGRHPSTGRTWMAVRCHDTFTSPATGDSTTWRPRPPTAPPPPPTPAHPSPPPSRRSPRRIGRPRLRGIRAPHAPTRAARRPPWVGWCRAGHPGGRRAWRRRRAPGLRAAQDRELVGECPALLLPRSLLVALFRDHVGGRARDEVLVGEPGRERGQLAVEPYHFARQALAFLLHVDRALQGDEHFAAVAEDRVGDGALHAAVEREFLDLCQALDRLAFRFEDAPAITPARLDARPETRPRGNLVLGANDPDFLDGLLHAQERRVEVRVDQLWAERRPARRHQQFVRLPSRELLPQLLGDERHDGMEQTQGDVAAMRQHRLRRRRPGVLAGQSRLDGFDIPVRELAPDELVAPLGGLIELELVQI